MERQAQHPERLLDVDFAVRFVDGLRGVDPGVGVEVVMRPAAGADDELPYAVHRFGDTGPHTRLRGQHQLGEALVDVAVAVQDDVGLVALEDLPHGVHGGIGVVVGVAGRGVRAGAGEGEEAGLMPVGEGARRGVGGEVGGEPLSHRAVGPAPVQRRVAERAALGRVALGVEDDDVPHPEVVAVVAEPVRARRAGRRGRRRPGARAGPVEVGEIVRRLGAPLVVVVARRRAGAALDAGLAPGRVVAVLIGGRVGPRARPAQVVGGVAEHGHGRGRVVAEQLGGVHGAAGHRGAGAAGRHVARGQEHRVRGGLGRSPGLSGDQCRGNEHQCEDDRTNAPAPGGGDGKHAGQIPRLADASLPNRASSGRFRPDGPPYRAFVPRTFTRF